MFILILTILVLSIFFEYLINVWKNKNIFSKSNIKKIIFHNLIYLLSSLIYFSINKTFLNDLSLEKFKIFSMCIILIMSLFSIINYGKQYKKLLEERKYIIKFSYMICLFLMISSFSEIFLFNFRHFESLNYKEDFYSVTGIGDGILYLDKNNYKILSDGEKYIEFDNINKEIKNLKIDISNLDFKKEKVDINILATDEANKLYFKLPTRTILQEIQKTQYINLNLSGVSEKIKIQINESQDNIININGLYTNIKRPFFISYIRFFILFILLCLIYIIRPSSQLYNYKYNSKSKIQKLIKIMAILFQIIIFFILVNSNNAFKKPIWQHHRQYNMLADAFINGNTYIDNNAPQSLKNMENPYDTEFRKKLSSETGDIYRWDTAFYNDKYYVYFGVVPVILLYLPFKIITGGDLSTYIGIFFVSIFFVIGLYKLLEEIIKKWFNNISFLVYLLICFIFINSCGMLNIMKQPSFYSMPIIMGITFAIIGIYFWISSFNEKNLISLKLFLGSLCMALIAGCRPQILISSFFAFPIFWNSVFKDRKLFSKKSFKQTFCFLIPYIFIALLLMYYNYVRFNSPFDFGANYNLTTNDMTKRGFNFDRIFLGIFAYLFQPPYLYNRFPFIKAVSLEPNYQGITIKESMFGGIIFCNIILVLNLFIFKLKNIVKKMDLFAICLMSIIFSVIIVIADTQMAGILSRYTSDFGWLLFLSVSIIIFSFNENFKDLTLNSIFYNFLFFSFIGGLLFNIFNIFVKSESSYFTYETVLFYKIASIVEFWL